MAVVVPTSDRERRRIVVVGHGAAGLCAALSALEAARQRAIEVELTVVDRAPAAACGGNSRCDRHG